MKHARKLPPLWALVLAFSAIYAAVSIALTRLLSLPWHVPMPCGLSLGVGLCLLLLGGSLMIGSFRSLSLRRALGKELFLDKSKSKLIVCGVYAYTRNPLYLSAILLLLGWFFVLRLTPVGILTALFLAHFIAVAKWEERELRERFGAEYEEYRKRVPFFLPNGRS